MAQMTPQVTELLEKALELSTQEAGLLEASRLIQSLDDEPAEEDVEAAWGGRYQAARVGYSQWAGQDDSGGTGA